MSTVVELVADDTGPNTILDIKDKDTGEAADLSDVATVQFKFRPVGSLVTTATVAPTVYGSPLNGQIEVDWGSSLTGVAAGNYEGEIQFTMTGGAIITVFDLVPMRIRSDFA